LELKRLGNSFLRKWLLLRCQVALAANTEAIGMAECFHPSPQSSLEGHSGSFGLYPEAGKTGAESRVGEFSRKVPTQNRSWNCGAGVKKVFFNC
jgi:hypothetical protein